MNSRATVTAMSVVSETGRKIPLGVGTIIGGSFSILFGNFFKFLALGFVGALLGFVVDGFVMGFEVAAGMSEPANAGLGSLGGTELSLIVNTVIYSVITGLVVQLAYDAKLGRSHSFGTYLRSALPAIIPIIVLNFVVWILSVIGLIALLVGALWVIAVFSMIAPVAVIERAGFGSMGRSAALTKEYRWPIVGIFIVLAIIIVLVSSVSAFGVGFAVFALAAGWGGVIAMGVIISMLTGLAYAIGGITMALIYARLREIKEGVSVDQVASVFD